MMKNRAKIIIIAIISVAILAAAVIWGLDLYDSEEEESASESFWTTQSVGFYGYYFEEAKERGILCDVTGDGINDLCYSNTFGSGMVRTRCIVYDRVEDETYVLDGYNYDYFVQGEEDGRLVVLESGPNGYGDPITETLGTVELQDGILVFVPDGE